MNNDFMPGADPEEIKHFLHDLGLIPLDEYYTQVKQMLKRQEQSSKITHEQIQKKLAENGIYTDDSSKNISLLCTRKRTSFSPVITRKRGKAIKKRTPSASQIATAISSTQKLTDEVNTIDDDQPLDLRLRKKSSKTLMYMGEKSRAATKVLEQAKNCRFSSLIPTINQGKQWLSKPQSSDD